MEECLHRTQIPLLLDKVEAILNFQLEPKDTLMPVLQIYKFFFYQCWNISILFKSGLVVHTGVENTTGLYWLLSLILLWSARFQMWLMPYWNKNIDIKFSVHISGITSGFATRLTWRVPLVEQELISLPENPSSPLVFSGVRVARSSVLCVCFVDRCLFFCTFSFGHCVVCSSSIYKFWLPLCYLQTLLSPSGTCMLKIEKIGKYKLWAIKPKSINKTVKISLFFQPMWSMHHCALWHWTFDIAPHIPVTLVLVPTCTLIITYCDTWHMYYHQHQILWHLTLFFVLPTIIYNWYCDPWPCDIVLPYSCHIYIHIAVMVFL
jgi:hypothetical protein